MTSEQLEQIILSNHAHGLVPDDNDEARRLAQSVEQSPRKAQVGGSIPSAGSSFPTKIWLLMTRDYGDCFHNGFALTEEEANRWKAEHLAKHPDPYDLSPYIEEIGLLSL